MFLYVPSYIAFLIPSINSSLQSGYIAEQIDEGLKEKGINAYCSKVELNETAKNMAIYEA